MVKFGNNNSRKGPIVNRLKLLKKANPVVLVFLAMPLLICVCVVVASHSIISNERNHAEMIDRNQRNLAKNPIVPTNGIRTDILDKMDPNGEIDKKGNQALWDMLIDEAEALAKYNGSKENIHVTEIGMHKPKECLRAANHELNAHCIEPSPISNSRILLGFDRLEEDKKKGVRFYKAAAGAETGKYVTFQSEGTQGDHVGDLMDMWEMKRKEPEKHGQAWLASKVEPFLVKTIAIDDLIDNKVTPTVDYSDGHKVDKMFLVKIDTQGYEPEVLKGMKKSLKEHKIDFIIAEYWPKGMDLMVNATAGERCDAGVGVLKTLADAGYILFAMPIVHHPKAPNAAREYVRPKYSYHIDFTDFRKHCEYFYEVEEKFPASNYHMGYWTDILAVSPNARLSKFPNSELGHIMLDILHPSKSSFSFF